MDVIQEFWSSTINSFFRNFDLKTCISMERNQCSLYSMGLMFPFNTNTIIIEHVL